MVVLVLSVFVGLVAYRVKTEDSWILEFWVDIFTEEL